MVTIEIAIFILKNNSTRGVETLYPAGMRCPQWRDDS